MRELKESLLHAIDSEASAVFALVNDIGAHPELGYREYRTSEIVADYFRSCGYDPQDGLAITGVKAKLKEETVSPTIALLGELDGVVCKESTNANPLTGATHTCGHNLQLGVLLLVAHAMRKCAAGNELCGNIAFLAVPSEEYIELEYKRNLKQEGKIVYFGGKQELVRLGVFDDIDAAMMVHSESNRPDAMISTYATGNGFNSKRVSLIGKTAHAAAFPDEGINALHAAIIGINAINALRETFRDADHNRIHYIITKGGDNVNSIPSDVKLEAYVRSSSQAMIGHLSGRFDQAFYAGAQAIGASAKIETFPGYLPLACDARLNDSFVKNALSLDPMMRILRDRHFMASTDMGDLSHLMPAIHPMTGGVRGSLHAADFEMVDYGNAVVVPAKIIALTLVDLLTGGGSGIRNVLDNHKPLLTKNEYLGLLDSFSIVREIGM